MMREFHAILKRKMNEKKEKRKRIQNLQVENFRKCIKRADRMVSERASYANEGYYLSNSNALIYMKK